MEKTETYNYLREQKICVLIPTYNNAEKLEEVLRDVSAYCADILLVNDGSTDGTKEILSRWNRQISIISYEKNRGKGYALKRGFEEAERLGFVAAITMDSDGQHKAQDLPLFAEAHKADASAMVIGSRSFDNPNMPQQNSFANRFSNFWFAVQTLHSLPDTQTGYRLYPLKRLGYITPFNKRYEAELELLVRCAWRLVPLRSIQIHVYYPPKEERISHFRPGWDFFRISLLNTALCLLAICYGYPSMLIRLILKKLKL